MSAKTNIIVLIVVLVVGVGLLFAGSFSDPFTRTYLQIFPQAWQYIKANLWNFITSPVCLSVAGLFVLFVGYAYSSFMVKQRRHERPERNPIMVIVRETAQAVISEVTGEIKTPDRAADFLQWMKAWDHVIVSWKEIRTDQEIMDELARRGYPSSKKTYNAIYAAGMADLLTMREYERKFGRKET